MLSFSSKRSYASCIAGDKCRREQRCFGFEKYMNIAEAMAAKRANATSNIYDTIVLTSDSREMMEARFNYTKNETFPFRFVVNDEDVLQGHGNPMKYNTKFFTADQVMISTMVAMKMQLLSDTLLPNSCSHFHQVMVGFYSSGCGMVREPYHEILKQNDNPSFRMKCIWDK